MLYETFNSLKEAHGEDYFTSRVDIDIVKNLNPQLELREYQKEALGRKWKRGRYRKVIFDWIEIQLNLIF